MNASVAVTQGITAGGEFQVVGGGSCTAGTAYLPAQTCTLNVVFTPLYPGRRDGAVRVVSNDGRLLASTLLSANATGSLPVLSPGRMDTVAGDRSWVYTGDGVPAVGAPIFLPQGLAVDVTGNLYLSDASNSRIRRVDASTGLISTVVGNGTPGFNGDGLPGSQTSVSQPAGLALDGAGNLYFADAGNNAVRRLDALSGVVTTVAGQPGMSGYAGDGGPATAAKLTLPEGLAFNAAGDLLIADTGNSAIRRVEADHGIIHLFAGTGLAGFGGDGGSALNAMLNTPWNVTVAPDGSVLIADFGNDRVRKISPAGIISTLVGNGARGFSGDGGAPSQAELSEPAALALDPAGNLYIADSGNNRVRTVSVADGFLHTLVGNSGDSFAGDGGPANEASLYGPYALAFSAGGDLFVADIFHNRVRRVSAHTLTLNYATIRVSKTSSPQAEGLVNAGNAALTLDAPGLVNAALDSDDNLPRRPNSAGSRLRPGRSIRTNDDWIPGPGFGNG